MAARSSLVANHQRGSVGAQGCNSLIQLVLIVLKVYFAGPQASALHSTPCQWRTGVLRHGLTAVLSPNNSKVTWLNSSWLSSLLTHRSYGVASHWHKVTGSKIWLLSFLAQKITRFVHQLKQAHRFYKMTYSLLSVSKYLK